MENMFRFADELGPFKIIHVYEPSADLKAVLVVDNIARGPAIGGVRMAPDISTEECFRLARTMTLKNAAADLPHGGGKVVIYGDPRMPQEKKSQMLRALASALRYEEEYIFAPDMGTDEICMACIKDEIGRVVGLPCEVGGIPLDEVGATGWGLAQATEVALQYCDFELKDARVVVQGFGAVGRHAARFLTQRGAIIVGAADSRGTVYDPYGLDVDTLIMLKKEGKSVIEYPGGKKLDSNAVIAIPCDIWIPAARPDVINENNVHLLDAKLIIEGANIPITGKAEKILYEAGILYIPDFIANAGGVICAAAEYQGATQYAAFGSIEEKVRKNTAQILETAKKKGILPREAAVQLAVKRVKQAMAYRRWSIFSSAPGFV
ncbi:MULTISPECIES: Glu/Leu/Phe/Val family dehydrogenase [Methanosarcina]|uniref:Glutamate dehydrogenase n=2 Tax=Methanosarcina barkeri TaxID=2208 RepID=A0A0E3QRR6_METBA|nr:MULTISPECIES: Glu/Leu/Phe/Val dehydrogenase [Methanosarcina]AKB53914.1 Glutamate dehydrogenase 2 [Methanosarcina barkeri MS]AKJ39708.1 glutamate dehydrogenase [Methanosarcina barkeri CM1]